MRKYLDVIKSSRLFRDIDDGEIEAMLACLSVSSREYAKNEFILRAGERSSSIGLVLAGAVHIIKEDFLGNRNIIAEAQPGEIFAESYACVPGTPLGVSAAAAERSEVMFMDVSRVLTVCGSACAFHARLMRNLLAVLAEKNLQFSEKLTYMTQRSTRQKLLSYLSAESLRRGSCEFEIPFNRQQLADYLSVDRSALCSTTARTNSRSRRERAAASKRPRRCIISADGGKAMYSTEKTGQWFARYVDSFRVGGALENMQELKRKHSRRVCAISCAIAESLEWNEERDAWLAHAIGLLHDTARFEQYRDYKTFADAASFDHGERGAEILARGFEWDGLEEGDKEKLLAAVRHHNKIEIPPSTPLAQYRWCALARDADKIDVFRMVQSRIDNGTIYDMLPRHKRVTGLTPALVEEVRATGRGSYLNARSLQDYRLIQLTWGLDLNFPSSSRGGSTSTSPSPPRRCAPRESSTESPKT